MISRRSAACNGFMRRRHVTGIDRFGQLGEAAAVTDCHLRDVGRRRCRGSIGRFTWSLADAVGLGRRRRLVARRRLGQAAARRLAGERRVFLASAPEQCAEQIALGSRARRATCGCSSSSMVLRRPLRPAAARSGRPAARSARQQRTAGVISASGLNGLRVGLLACGARLTSGSFGQLAALAWRRWPPAAAGCGLAAPPAASARGIRCRRRPLRRPSALQDALMIFVSNGIVVVVGRTARTLEPTADQPSPCATQQGAAPAAPSKVGSWRSCRHP